MSKSYCNFKFDNIMLRDVFVELLPNIAPDISAFMKSGMEARGIPADPEIVIDPKKEVVKVNLFSENKGSVLVLGDAITYKDYSSLASEDLYAILNARTRNLEMFVKRSPIDTQVGSYATFKTLEDSWKAVEIPPLPEIEEAVMEVAKEEEPLEAVVVDE